MNVLLTCCTLVQYGHASAGSVKRATLEKDLTMLNERARDIFTFIQRYRREHGSAPTIREIGHQFEISSTNGVRYYLNLLEKAGYIRRTGGISRGIGPSTPQ